MNNIDDMPPKCHDCPCCEMCEEPYICPLPGSMENEKAIIEFHGDDLNMILEYKKQSGAVDIKTAIMNAISIALDDEDWKPVIVTIAEEKKMSIGCEVEMNERDWWLLLDSRIRTAESNGFNYFALTTNEARKIIKLLKESVQTEKGS